MGPVAGIALIVLALALVRRRRLGPIAADRPKRDQLRVGIPADAAAEGLSTAFPGLKMAATLARMQAVDFYDPATAARERRLASSGALRIEDARGGWVNKPHDFLFGPEGLDRRARLVASQDAEAGLRKVGITPDDPRFAALEQQYVVGHARGWLGLLLIAAMPSDWDDDDRRAIKDLAVCGGLLLFGAIVRGVIAEFYPS
jgi:hypothetical protein